MSLILATKGRADFLPDSVASMAGTLAADDELIVVESGSGGVTAALAGLDTVRFRIEHIQTDRANKSHQLNLGIGSARSEVLLFTDDDARLDPGWADAMALPFADPAVGAAFGRVRGLTMAPGFDAPPAVPAGEAPLETWDFAHGVAMAVRRVAAFEVGGFDERLGPGAPAVAEDHDLVLRLRERGWRVVIVDAPSVSHLGWRSDEEDRVNAIGYERGGGALIGAALRRSPRGGARILKRRLGYQRMLLETDRRFGVRALLAFGGGLIYGLRLRRRDWLR